MTTRRTAMKALAGGVGAMLAAGALPGCSRSSRRTVRFTFSKREAIGFMNQVIADYNASQDRYEVVMDTSGPGAISASFVRGAPPDLMLARHNHEISRFIQRCTLSDLSDTDIAATIDPGTSPLSEPFGECTGRISTLPYSSMACAIVYNKRIFAEHDLRIPTTWTELIELCDTLMDAGITPFYATFADAWTVGQGWFDYAIGGALDVDAFYRQLTAQGTDVGAGSAVSFQKDFLEPIERMQLLARDYTQSDAKSRTYDFGNVEFARGGGAMYMQGPWAMAEVAKIDPEVELGTFPLPMTEDPADLKVVASIDLATMIPQDAANPEGARDFLAHLYEPQIIEAYNASQMGFVPTTTSAIPTDPRIAGMVDAYTTGAIYLAPGQINPPAIPTNNYAQSLVLGADARTILGSMDADWARVAFRRSASASKEA
ncbi:ABC transporter substrate-binding protein [Brachybacterium hainanense]|uniref:ABC transporter substrate-binding protein n=1 Tax=Brachybacterium hainanense TaxID=1541174 RepID=A0ABV6R8H3_9MICO